MRPLELPRHRVVVLSERILPDNRGFLALRRQTIEVHFEDGVVSEPFEYDAVHRTRLDAIVILPHFQDVRGERHVLLRSALRPPVATRPVDLRPVPEKESLGALWEVPAGLVEIDERSPDGLLRCAARELYEEVGIRMPANQVKPLGPSTFPAPGIIGERHFFFHVEVPSTGRITPPEDGSVLERCGAIVELPLSEALSRMQAGEIEDAKSEIALRRLAELA